MSEPMTVAEARDALDDAQRRCKAAEEALKAARDEVAIASSEVLQARLRADADLPRAKLVKRAWRSSETTTEEVVIVRRSPKQITTRYPGGEYTMAFRHDGTNWREYPAPRDNWCRTSITLELPAETQENKA